MRGNSQLVRSTSLRCVKNICMTTTLMLLVTTDSELENLVADVLLQIGGVSHLAHEPGQALQTVCGVHDLNVAIIDFENGPHGMTLLSTIGMLREDLPIIVITRDDERHVEALAYANGARACFPKSVSTTQLASAIRESQRSKPALAPV